MAQEAKSDHGRYRHPTHESALLTPHQTYQPFTSCRKHHEKGVKLGMQERISLVSWKWGKWSPSSTLPETNVARVSISSSCLERASRAIPSCLCSIALSSASISILTFFHFSTSAWSSSTCASRPRALPSYIRAGKLRTRRCEEKRQAFDMYTKNTHHSGSFLCMLILHAFFLLLMRSLHLLYLLGVLSP